MSGPRDALEIERKYLLDAVPELPADASACRLEQGYLPAPADAAGPWSGGRLRRSTDADGRVVRTQTIKEGAGLVRRERERTLDEATFAALWPATAGRRLVKTRWTVPADGVAWEIDVFESIDLVLAEVELPDADHAPPVPAWLAPRIVREVTDDPAYTNAALAAAPAGSRGLAADGDQNGNSTPR